MYKLSGKLEGDRTYSYTMGSNNRDVAAAIKLSIDYIESIKPKTAILFKLQEDGQWLKIRDLGFIRKFIVDSNKGR